MTKHEEILKFISHFNIPEVVHLFTHGQCYWFARLLQERFSDYQHLCYIVYNPIDNHFALQHGKYLYDATGVVGSINDSSWVDWDIYKIFEPLDAARVERDCIKEI